MMRHQRFLIWTSFSHDLKPELKHQPVRSYCIVRGRKKTHIHALQQVKKIKIVSKYVHKTWAEASMSVWAFGEGSGKSVWLMGRITSLSCFCFHIHSDISVAYILEKNNHFCNLVWFYCRSRPLPCVYPCTYWKSLARLYMCVYIFVLSWKIKAQKQWLMFLILFFFSMAFKVMLGYCCRLVLRTCKRLQWRL